MLVLARRSLRRGALSALLALAPALAGLPIMAGCESQGTRQGYEPVQPIEYSHALHAGERNIDCQYCHFGAETSRHAGVPPASVCLNCHSQVRKDSPEVKKIQAAVDTGEPIEWVKVHRLADFVYFNHARHVGAGVACQSCHGPVETMVRVRQVETMSMGWCLDCHRAPGQSVPDPALVAPPTDCAACHQ